MHRAACLPEIDCFESGRCPRHRPQMPLGFLNKVEERVSVPIGRGQGCGERALERGKRRAADDFDGGPPRSARAGCSGLRPLRECVREQPQEVRSRRSREDRRSCASAGSLRVGSGPDAGNHAEARRRTYSARAGRPNSSAPPFWFSGDLRVVCAALPLGGGTLGPCCCRSPCASLNASNDKLRQAFEPDR